LGIVENNNQEKAMLDRLSNRIVKIDGNTAAQIYRKIALIDEFKGWFKAGLALSPQILGRLKRSVVVSSTGSSTRIEGAKMSDAEVEALLLGLKINRLKDRDGQEVAGYAELTNIIFDRYENIKISENEILGLHKILLKYSEKDVRHKGNYKNVPNKVTARDAEGNESIIFNPTEPYLVRAEMRDLMEWAQRAADAGEIHPLMITANFILEFLSIHPFEDGNGRLSRAMTNLFMLKNGYKYVQYASLEKIIGDNKADYYLALRRSQAGRKTEKEDITAWLVFFFDVLEKQARTARKTAEEGAGEDALSENQASTLGLFERHEKITNKIIVNELALNRDTAKQVLGRLVVLKLVKRTGRGRSTGYVRRIS
jgi:Fic family protein